MSYHVLDENDFVTYYVDGKPVQVGSIRLKEIFRAELEGRLMILDEPPKPVHPCNECIVGYGPIGPNSWNSFRETCVRLAEYHAKLKGGQP